MATAAAPVFFIGKPSSQNIAMLARLGRRGWSSHSVGNLREAENLMKTSSFDLALTSSWLRDGSGYELAASVAECGGSLFVEIGLTEQTVWVPVVERGERVFGQRAISAQELEWVAEQILLAAHEAKLPTNRKGMGAAAGHIGYPPTQIPFGATCTPAVGTANRGQSRISSIAQLQLRHKSFGLLRTDKGRNGPAGYRTLQATNPSNKAPARRAAGAPTGRRD